MFNADDFLNSALATPLSTEFQVIPEGDHPFLLDADPEMLKPREVKFNDKQTGEPKSFFQLELTAVCQSDKVRADMGRDRVTCRMRVNLDLDSSGRLDGGKGKNVALGRLFEAVGKNRPGVTIKDLLGAGPFIGRVKHTRSEKDGRVYADISNVAPIAR